MYLFAKRTGLNFTKIVRALGLLQCIDFRKERRTSWYDSTGLRIYRGKTSTPAHRLGYAQFISLMGVPLKTTRTQHCTLEHRLLTTREEGSWCGTMSNLWSLRPVQQLNLCHTINQTSKMKRVLQLMISCLSTLQQRIYHIGEKELRVSLMAAWPVAADARLPKHQKKELKWSQGLLMTICMQPLAGRPRSLQTVLARLYSVHTQLLHQVTSASLQVCQK
ncbi:uncharacterized protein LOC144102111 [Amblyomma americanum]|uniref:Uncharacterized protein n=1 Tax=Amblyomma americanum TaxID=6943 RepID=A0AAQ4DEB9_AMBAM